MLLAQFTFANTWRTSSGSESTNVSTVSAPIIFPVPNEYIPVCQSNLVQYLTMVLVISSTTALVVVAAKEVVVLDVVLIVVTARRRFIEAV